MKHKLRKILFIFVLAFGFMINVNAETIKEDVSTYDGDVYIIGSSKFDSDVIVTGTMASMAGAWETYIQFMIYDNYEYNPSDLRIYYYSELDETWSILPVQSGDEFIELTEEEVEEFTENLNVYFVNEEEKVLEIPYEVNLEEGYELGFSTDNPSKDSEVKYEAGKLLIPATVRMLRVYAESEHNYKLLDGFEQTEAEFENYLTVPDSVDSFMDAVESEEVTYIELSKDVDLPTAIEVTKELRVNLNGYNLTISKDTAGDGVFHVLEGGDLTIEGDGIVDGVGNNDYNIAIFAEAGKVTINGGTYTNTGLVPNPEDEDNNHFDLIYAKGTAEVIINGGRFEGYTPAWLLNQKDADRETSSITVYGGTFVGFNPADNAAEGEGTNFVADGCKVVKKGNNYTVEWLEKNDVLLVDGIAYETLTDAVANAEDGATIKLLNNVDSETAVEITKAVTINLNGYNLTISKDTAGDGVFHVLEGGDLTINGEGVVDGVGKNDYNIAIFAEAGKVTINGGTYTNTGLVPNSEDEDNNHFDLIYAKGTAEVVINGGRFEGYTPAWLLNLKDANRDTASITVYGGTFVGFNPADNAAEGEGTNFVAEGYKVIHEFGEYSVVEATDEIVVTGDSLQDVIDNANAGSVVNITKDMDLPTAVKITKAVIINLNGYRLSISEDTAGDGVFHVLEGGDLVINGEGIVDGVGKNDYNIAIFAEAGKVTINGGTYTNTMLIPNPDDEDNNHFDLIYAKGTAQVEIYGGIFEGYTPAWLLNLKDANRDTASITVYGGTFVGFNPADNAAEGEGTNFVAENYTVVEDNEVYTVVSAEE